MLCVLFGTLLLAAGAALVWFRARLRVPGSSVATQVVMGLALGLIGYHALVWSLPAGWGPPGLPIGRWWALGLPVLACVCSFAVDSIERGRLSRAGHEGAGSGNPGGGVSYGGGDAGRGPGDAGGPVV